MFFRMVAHADGGGDDYGGERRTAQMIALPVPITKLSIPKSPDSSVSSAKDLEWMHYTSTPSQPFRVGFRSSNAGCGYGRIERMRMRLEVIGGDAIYAALELGEYSRSWDYLPFPPLGYKMKEKCVLIKYTSLGQNRDSTSSNRFQLRFANSNDAQSFITALNQHCPQLVVADRPPMNTFRGEGREVRIDTPTVGGRRVYGMGGGWEGDSPTQPTYDADGFKIPKRPAIQPLRLPPREYDANLSSARQRYASSSPALDRDLDWKNERGSIGQSRVGGETPRNGFDDFNSSQELFAEDTQMQSQTQPTGYTQQMMPLPIPYHPSPLKFGGEASMRRREEWAGMQCQSLNQSQSQRMSPDVFGGTTSRDISPRRDQQETTKRESEFQSRKVARGRSVSEVRDSLVPTIQVREQDQSLTTSQRVETFPSMRVEQPEACPSGRPTLVDVHVDHLGDVETQELEIVPGQKIMPAVDVQQDIVITSVKAASQLYELPEQELAELMAEVLREDGFEGFVTKVRKMSWRALALIGGGAKPDDTT